MPGAVLLPIQAGHGKVSAQKILGPRMRQRWNSIKLTSFFVFASVLFCNSISGDLVYSIGNSLTWDAQPEELQTPGEHHIRCASNLQQIFDDPNTVCVNTSRIWTDALNNTQYDFVTVQPHFQTTLDQDATVISHWMGMQPNAQFVIHTGWTRHFQHESDYHGGNPNNTMVHSPEYFSDLISEIESRTGRTLLTTRMNEILDAIYHDIALGKGPFSDFSELYRDDIHAEFRSLPHNALRFALGQPLDFDRFGESPHYANYFRAKITGIPEPNGLWFVCIVSLTLAGLTTKIRLLSRS